MIRQEFIFTKIVVYYGSMYLPEQFEIIYCLN